MKTMRFDPPLPPFLCVSKVLGFATRSQQVIAAIDQPPVDYPSLFGQGVGLGIFFIHDVQDCVSMRYQIVGNQHAMAAEIKLFRAHNSGICFLGAFHQSRNGLREFV